MTKKVKVKKFVIDFLVSEGKGVHIMKYEFPSEKLAESAIEDMIKLAKKQKRKFRVLRNWKDLAWIPEGKK